MSRRHDKDKHLKREVEEVEKRLSKDEKLIRSEGKSIRSDERAIKDLQGASKKVQSYIVKQDGDNMPTNKTVISGSGGSFTAQPVPSNGVSGPPTWASDNALAVVSTDPNDASGLTVNVAVDASANGSFNLSVASTNSDGTVATGTLNVQITPAAGSPVVSSYNIIQNS